MLIEPLFNDNQKTFAIDCVKIPMRLRPVKTMVCDKHRTPAQ